MLKKYDIMTKVEAFLLTKQTDKDFIAEFLTGIPHGYNDEGLVIVGPDGETTIEYDQFYLLFEPATNQLLTIEKKRFEESAMLVIDTTSIDSWEGTNETLQ